MSMGRFLKAVSQSGRSTSCLKIRGSMAATNSRFRLASWVRERPAWAQDGREQGISEGALNVDSGSLCRGRRTSDWVGDAAAIRIVLCTERGSDWRRVALSRRIYRRRFESLQFVSDPGMWAQWVSYLNANRRSGTFSGDSARKRVMWEPIVTRCGGGWSAESPAAGGSFQPEPPDRHS
jgi:hypothetical protein